ncbi:MAG: glycine cleavage system aminomethyltransferase GcvT [Candidatus Omnitrophica bacterium]|nr:glycine cleavage system aminomethyltransferase GcvT [Candidatus Omnitrophota bacterium]
MKRTPLFEAHRALGATIVPFAGYELPMVYSSIVEEHRAARNQAAMFDVSHLGEIRLDGPGAAAFLDRTLPTRLEDLADGRIRYSAVLADDGGILDDILVYRMNGEAFFLIVNASNIGKIVSRLEALKPASGVNLNNESDRWGCVAVQGPGALAACCEAFGEDYDRLLYYQFTGSERAGNNVWVSRSGYTGEDGFEFFAEARELIKVWDRLLNRSGKLGLKPAGLGARNTLRLEAGNGLYGADFDEATVPMEVRLGWLVDWEKDFVGKEALLERRRQGIARRLCGFKLRERGVARDGYPVTVDGRNVGRVTSGSFSPTLGASIGLALVSTECTKAGTVFDIEVHGRRVPAEVVKLPFVPLRHKQA